MQILRDGFMVWESDWTMEVEMLDVLYLEDNHIRKNKFKKDVCVLGKVQVDLWSSVFPRQIV